MVSVFLNINALSLIVQFDTEAGNRTRSKYHCKIACIKMQSYTSRPSILVIDAVKDTIIYFTDLRACLIMMLYVEEMYYSCTIVHILGEKYIVNTVQVAQRVQRN